MAKRTWRRVGILAGVLVVALVAAAGVWACGTEEVAVGQTPDEAEAALRRAGAKNVSHKSSRGGAIRPGDGRATWGSVWELPDGRTLWLNCVREHYDAESRVVSVDLYLRWPTKVGDAHPLPHGDSVRLRQSVFALVPH